MDEYVDMDGDVVSRLNKERKVRGECTGQKGF
jgi:hypothetical protein